MSPVLRFVVMVPIVKGHLGRVAVAQGVPREHVLVQVGQELKAALVERCRQHEAVAPGVTVQQEGG